MKVIRIVFYSILFSTVITCQQATVPTTDSQDDSPYQYLPLADIEHKLQELEANYLSIADMHSLADNQRVPYKTHDGHSLYAVKVSDNVAVDEDEPVGVFIAGQHAREWLAIAVGYYMLEHIIENYDKDLDIKKIVDSTELWFVPVVNPDGYVYTHTSQLAPIRYWRKNRLYNGKGKDGNDVYGVDLNRNWGYKWGEEWAMEDWRSSSSDLDMDTYRGSAAFSELETQAIRDLLSDNNPDVFIDYHAAAQMILYPYGYTSEILIDNTNSSVVLATLYYNALYAATQRKYELQAAYKIYPHNGNAIDYVYHTYNIPSINVEVRPDGKAIERFAPSTSEIQPTVEENLAGLFAAINYIIQQAEEEN